MRAVRRLLRDTAPLGAWRPPVPLPWGDVSSDELDPLAKTYALTGTHRDRLKLDVPYDIDIDISAEALDAL
ncbi:hypothetical protein ACFWOT_08355 [Streptomyces sp. NPDC058440]|uniref:hypothetical protein n=1 Tax=Streptomyces sp. NPDC058440 TaxID=3346501 RepID=UPI00364CA69D